MVALAGAVAGGAGVVDGALCDQVVSIAPSEKRAISISVKPNWRIVLDCCMMTPGLDSVANVISRMFVWGGLSPFFSFSAALAL